MGNQCCIQGSKTKLGVIDSLEAEGRSSIRKSRTQKEIMAGGSRMIDEKDAAKQ